MGSLVVIGPEPLCGQFLGLGNRLKVMQVQPFVSGCSIEALDVSILGWLTRLDIKQRNLPLVSPIY